MTNFGRTPYPDDLPGSQGETSSEAAAVVKVSLMQRQMRVLAKINMMGNATADDVAASMDVVHNTVAPRMTELKAMGYLAKSGFRRVTRAGCKANVLQLTAEGVLALRKEAA